MKKTIAKLMAVAVVAASIPAMTLPTFATTTRAAASDTQVGTVVVGNYVLSMKGTNNVELPSSLISPATSGVAVSNDGNVVKTPIQLTGKMQAGTYNIVSKGLKNDGFIYYEVKNVKGPDTLTVEKNGAAYTYDTAFPTSGNALLQDGVELKAEAMVNATLTAGDDYIDNADVVQKITTDNKGYVVITFNAAKLDTYKNNTILKGLEPKKIQIVVGVDATGKNVTLDIPVGEQFNSGSDNNKYTGAYSADGYVTSAKVTVDKAGNATLTEVAENDKKVTMLKQNIDLSEIIISGIHFPVEKLDDKVLKSAKMKQITAKNVKHLGNGCLRNCKKLRKARLGGAKMRKIHSNAFYDCEKLKNIKINVKNLKSVGSKAFMNIKKNCTISLKGPSSKYKKAVKMIKKSGTGQVKFKKA
jgi:hypothetical protein